MICPPIVLTRSNVPSIKKTYFFFHFCTNQNEGVTIITLLLILTGDVALVFHEIPLHRWSLCCSLAILYQKGTNNKALKTD